MMVMYFTGDGDETKAFYKLVELMNVHISQVITDEQRAEMAKNELLGLEQYFIARRETLGEVHACIAKVDATYDVTSDDYRACNPNRETQFEEDRKKWTQTKIEFRKAFTDAEWSELEQRLMEDLKR